MSAGDDRARCFITAIAVLLLLGCNAAPNADFVGTFSGDSAITGSCGDGTQIDRLSMADGFTASADAGDSNTVWLSLYFAHVQCNTVSLDVDATGGTFTPGQMCSSPSATTSGGGPLDGGISRDGGTYVLDATVTYQLERWANGTPCTEHLTGTFRRTTR
ncbi:MAG: hypothetical protein QM723_10665 [Myxococcaceae bacterium]